MSTMPSPAQPEPDVHDMLAELTTWHTHSERYELRDRGTLWAKRHNTRVPALVHQLLSAMPAGSGVMSGSTPTSRPTAHIEALDTIMLIDDEAGRWLERLGEDAPEDSYDRDRPIAGSGTIARLRRVHVLHGQVESCQRYRGRKDDQGDWCCTRHRMEHDVRRWWHQARIITGWDSPPYRPWNTCPVCEYRGGLRINLELSAAFCTECRAVWDASQIGLLADHIRAENLEADTPPFPRSVAPEADDSAD